MITLSGFYCVIKYRKKFFLHLFSPFQIFLNFVPTVVMNPAQIAQEVENKILNRYASRLLKLKVIFSNSKLFMSWLVLFYQTLKYCWFFFLTVKIVMLEKDLKEKNLNSRSSMPKFEWQFGPLLSPRALSSDCASATTPDTSSTWTSIKKCRTRKQEFSNLSPLDRSR